MDLIDFIEIGEYAETRRLLRVFVECGPMERPYVLSVDGLVAGSGHAGAGFERAVFFRARVFGLRTDVDLSDISDEWTLRVSATTATGKFLSHTIPSKTVLGSVIIPIVRLTFDYGYTLGVTMPRADIAQRWGDEHE